MFRAHLPVLQHHNGVARLLRRVKPCEPQVFAFRAINGSMGGANNARLTPADQMLAKTTRIAGIVFFVVAILACLFAGRLAG